jgi:hypothetical protein
MARVLRSQHGRWRRAFASSAQPAAERDDEGREWMAHARQRIVQSPAAFARGETSEVTPDELMDGIEKELGPV